jgi:hypothetical protein
VSELTHSGLVKIRIPLLGSARDSGFDSETVWAEPLPDGTFRIWNLPVFAYNIDMRDIVKCRPDPEDPEGALPVVTEVVEQGDCYTIRLYFELSASEEQIEEVLDLLSERDAMFEKSSRELCDSHQLWAVGLRTPEDYDWVGPALQPFVDAGILTFESAFQPDEPSYEAAG